MRSTLTIPTVCAVLLATTACSGSSQEKKADAPTEQTSTTTNDDVAAPPADTTGAAVEEEPAPAAAEVDLAAVEDLETLFTVSGNADKARIGGIIGQKKPDVFKCYSDALAANPGMAGRVLVQITTTPNGGVASALIKQSTLKKPAVEQCMLSKIRGWTFPHDESGGLVVIKYAFQLPP